MMPTLTYENLGTFGRRLANAGLPELEANVVAHEFAHVCANRINGEHESELWWNEYEKVLTAIQDNYRYVKGYRVANGYMRTKPAVLCPDGTECSEPEVCRIAGCNLKNRVDT